MTSIEQRVSAADFVRQFGVWRERASKDPIYVTHHGRNSHVLMGIDRFEELGVGGGAGGTREAEPDPVSASLTLLAHRVKQAVIIVDRDLAVQFANRLACDHMMLPHDAVIGRPLDQIVPHLRDAAMYRNLMRALHHGEVAQVDLPSALIDGVWIELETLPVPAGAALLFRNITEEVRVRRSGEVQRALLRGLEAHGAIGHARLSPRGGFESANSVLCGMIGLSPEALTRARFVDIVASRDRPGFNQGFEQIFRSADPQQMACALISNTGGEIRTRLSLSALRGDYTPDGAVALVTLQ